MEQVTIRSETHEDIDAITEVTVAAFATLAISHQTEHAIVAALRAADALTLSLVAETDGRIVGHVAFSPVTIADGTPDWFGLGPVSVAPALQRQGIGSALIRVGLARLQALGARGCCLVGHPEYYGRFGFVHSRDLGVAGVPEEAFFALAFDGPLPHGEVTFHAAFDLDVPPADGADASPART